MDWKVIAALTLLFVAILVGLVIVMYTSVSRYAKHFDPGSRTPNSGAKGGGAVPSQPSPREGRTD